MQHHSTLSIELLITQITREGVVLSVRSHVQFQVRLGDEPTTAGHTAVGQGITVVHQTMVLL